MKNGPFRGGLGRSRVAKSIIIPSCKIKLPISADNINKLGFVACCSFFVVYFIDLKYADICEKS